MYNPIKNQIKLIVIRSVEYKNTNVTFATDRGNFVLMTLFMHASVQKG